MLPDQPSVRNQVKANKIEIIKTGNKYDDRKMCISHINNIENSNVVFSNFHPKCFGVKMKLRNKKKMITQKCSVQLTNSKYSLSFLYFQFAYATVEISCGFQCSPQL
jgi:regulation of enolase protein 1 (concanavalin A-like superfamily)